MSRRFVYVTGWRLEAPIEHVWDALVDVESRPRWLVRHLAARPALQPMTSAGLPA